MYSRFYTRCFLIGTIVVLGWLLLKFLDPFWGPLGCALALEELRHPEWAAMPIVGDLCWPGP